MQNFSQIKRSCFQHLVRSKICKRIKCLGIGPTYRTTVTMCLISGVSDLSLSEKIWYTLTTGKLEFCCSFHTQGENIDHVRPFFLRPLRLVTTVSLQVHLSFKSTSSKLPSMLVRPAHQKYRCYFTCKDLSETTPLLPSKGHDLNVSITCSVSGWCRLVLLLERRSLG